MKYLLILLALLFSGCSLSDKDFSERNFNKMCSKYELVICGDLESDIYTTTSMNDIQNYLSANFHEGTDYIYKADDGESYDYMYDYPMRGDCEDLVITILEDLAMLGMIDKGEARWVFGEREVFHAWLLITKNDKTFLFDTAYTKGIDLSLVENYYIEMFTVYEY